jgi:hypothetical protein
MDGWTPRVRWTVGLAAVAAAATLGCAPQGVGVGANTAIGSIGTDSLPAVTSFPLFDGKTLAGWRVYGSSAQPRGWYVKDGTLTKDQATDDIITTEQFGNFEFNVDWRIHSGGNAGIFYRVTEEYNKPYWSGVEYQLLDDPNHPDGKSRLTAAGAAFGLYPAPEGVVKPAGEWNHTRIVARGARVEHWLNGTKLLEYENGSADWNVKLAASKFAAWPNFGKARRGYIAIQGDHTGELSLRNIRIKELR